MVTKKTKQQAKNDLLYMQRALQLAHVGRPAPNPCVGAVLVKGGQIIGEGYNAAYGGAHGEIVAMQMAEKKGHLVDGATLYVTLEPCAHFGKTPPCVDSIMFSGITRVVIGCKDPNPVVGNGIAILREAGITVDVGVLGDACESFYETFFHYVKTKRPFVTLKSGMTLDGKIAKRNDQQTWITGTHAKTIAHQLRRDHDAILVGVGTVLSDDPQLTCRIPCAKQPLRVILDSRLRIPLDARVLIDKNIVIATTQHHNKKKFERLRARGVKFIVTKGKQVQLGAVLKALPSYGVLSVLVEGGAHVNATFLQKKYVDKLCFFIAPTLFGQGVDAVAGDLGSGLRLHGVTYKQIGKDVYVEGYVH